MQSEPWRASFRAFLGLPSVPTAGLEFLLHALRTDSPELVQCEPATIDGDGKITGGCAIGYVAWRGLRLSRWQEVSNQFNDWCEAAEERSGDAFLTDPFIDFFDGEHRHVSFPQIAVEVAAELERREAKVTARETADSLAAV